VRSSQVGSVLPGDLQTLLSPQQSPTAARADSSAQIPGAGSAIAPPPRTSGTPAVIAGVGVLLLAMGVGVVIGRSSGGSTKTAPAQVISVAPSASAVGAASTPSQTTAPTATTPAGSTTKQHSSKKSPSASESSTTHSSGVGQTPSKPAPPSVAEHLHGGKGQSYEQKSKNLPNVISTG
jgi:hypothetical protein